MAARRQALSAPFKVADLGTRVVEGSSFPGARSTTEPIWAELGGTVYFGADTPGHGAELWRSDGTPQGTSLVRDLNPGVDSAFKYSARDSLVAVNGALLLAANDGVHAQTAFRSDGTASGTTRLTAPDGGDLTTFLTSFTVVGGLAYFSSSGLPQGLWVTDGTQAGTRLVKPNVVFQSAIAFQGKLYGGAYETPNVNGLEPWVSDGTAAGTHVLVDLCPGSCSGNPLAFAVVGDALYFVSQTNGAHLYKSDGVSAVEVFTFDAGAFGSEWPVALRDALVFDVGYTAADRQLWITDGGESRRLGSVSPGWNTPYATGQELVQSAGKVFFRGKDDTHGVELWVTDGTDAGTVMVRDFLPGAPSGMAMRPAAFDGGVLFWADDGVSGVEPWFSDGTPQGTRLVANIAPGDAGTSAALPFFVTSSGWAYFSADDGVTGNELWRTDGTPQGTTRVANLNRLQTGAPTNLLALGGALLFSGATADGGSALMRSDGNGASLLSTLERGLIDPAPQRFVALDGVAYFAAVSARYSTDLWRSAGTPLSTSPLQRLFQSAPQPNSQQPLLAAAAGKVIGVGQAPPYYQLTSYSPSKGIDAGPDGGGLLVSLGGPYYVQELVPSDAGAWALGWAQNGSYIGTDLYFTDGTDAGTRRVANAMPALTTFRYHLTDLGGVAFYLGYTNQTGWQLYRSDGTDAGTLQLTGTPGSGLSAGAQPAWMTPWNGQVVFAGSHPDGGRELWRSDGTVAGTRRLVDVNPVGDSDPQFLTPWGSRLLFLADDGTGRHLMVSDGTSEGTRRVTELPVGLSIASETRADVHGGTVETGARILALEGGPAFFPAADEAGNEPWVVEWDGGVHRLGDLNPGPASSDPTEFTRAGDLVYFGADDGTGARLYAVSLTGLPGGGSGASSGGGSSSGSGGNSGAGGGSGTSGSGGGTAGGGSATAPGGCGCSSATAMPVLLGLALARGLRRRRRG
ncbi:MAG: hypothetical protein K1X89_27665 [Myxococcaceae bacterium]|nr:hypothetical protein [Myxococcaceae bacterium]